MRSSFALIAFSCSATFESVPEARLNDGLSPNDRLGARGANEGSDPPPSFLKQSRQSTGFLPFGLKGTSHDVPHSAQVAGKSCLSKPPACPNPPRLPPWPRSEKGFFQGCFAPPKEGFFHAPPGRAEPNVFFMKRRQGDNCWRIQDFGRKGKGEGIVE